MLLQKNWSKGIISASFVAVVGALTALSFQNCGSPSLAPNNTIESISSRIGFGYDVKFDQIAYMSCADINAGTADPSAYFTFRLGAYSVGTGLMLTKTFTQDTNVFPRTPADQAKMLTLSSANSNTQLQLSILSYSNFASYFTDPANTGDGGSTAMMFTELGTLPIATALLNLTPGDGLKHVRSELPQGYTFEGTLHLSSSSGVAQQMRTGFTTNQGVLAVTYSDDGQSYTLRTPATVAAVIAAHNPPVTSPSASPAPTSTPLPGGQTYISSAYGHGLQLQFGQPPVNGINGNYPNYVLTSVQREIDLTNRQIIPGAWNCDPGLQFRIMPTSSKSDLASGNCILQPDPDPVDPNSQLAIVRRSLKVEDWYVDMTNHCIIPKKVQGGGCYGTNVQTSILWDQTQLCTPNSSASTCIHYASICYRTK